MAAVTYDREADVPYVELAHIKDPGNKGEEVHPRVILMFDAVGKIIGIEIRPASKLVAGAAVAGSACRLNKGTPTPRGFCHEHNDRAEQGCNPPFFRRVEQPPT